MVMLFEMPLSHFTVHLMSAKPLYAWIVDALSLRAMLYLVAEYRASLWRPVSLTADAILIRYGVTSGDAVRENDMAKKATAKC